jgi:hypothetical protein
MKQRFSVGKQPRIVVPILHPQQHLPLLFGDHLVGLPQTLHRRLALAEPGLVDSETGQEPQQILDPFL